jgi:hypothetical protein
MDADTRWPRGLRPVELDAGLSPTDLGKAVLGHRSDKLKVLLVGHSTTVTGLVYRHQIRPVIQTGATVMDRLFGHRGQVRSHSVGHSPGRCGWFGSPEPVAGLVGDTGFDQ